MAFHRMSNHRMLFRRLTAPISFVSSCLIRRIDIRRSDILGIVRTPFYVFVVQIKFQPVLPLFILITIMWYRLHRSLTSAFIWTVALPARFSMCSYVTMTAKPVSPPQVYYVVCDSHFRVLLWNVGVLVTTRAAEVETTICFSAVDILNWREFQ